MTNYFDVLHPEPDINDVNLLRDLTILVVDDSFDNLMLLKFALEAYGAEVVTASNAVSAFEIIKKSPFNVLISDIEMPLENGCTLLQRIRALSDSPNQEILAIAFSANDEYEIQKLALNVGFKAYLIKPTLPERLIATIEQLLK